jgi:hypothetical protein
MTRMLQALAIALLFAAVPTAGADELIIEKLEAAKVQMPSRGMTMERVQDRFGAPQSRSPRSATRRSRAGNTRISSSFSSIATWSIAWKDAIGHLAPRPEHRFHRLSLSRVPASPGPCFTLRGAP